MTDRKGEPFGGQIQLLMETHPDFPQRLKQRILFDLNRVANPCQLIAGLLAKGVLSDGSNDSEGNSLLKEMMVQHAVVIACSKDAGAIGGLMDSLNENGNSQLISALRTWAKAEFAMDLNGDLSVSKGDDSDVNDPESLVLAKHAKNAKELSSSGTKLIDKVMCHEDKDLMEQLQGHLVGKASEIVNISDLCSTLVKLNVLDESDIKSKLGLELEEDQRIQKVIRAACSKKAIGSLVTALQVSGNEHILQQTLEWLDTSQIKRSNHPIAVKSLANYESKVRSKNVKPTFLEQPAPSDGLKKVASFDYKRAEGTIAYLEFDRKRMMAYLPDCTAKVWNWGDGEEKTIKFDVQVKNITCYQFDEEILVLGTSEGTVCLFDARTSQEKWSIRFSDPVHSLKFVESTLVVLTQGVQSDNFSWVDISRPNMQLLNRRLVLTSSLLRDSFGFFVASDYSFLYTHRCLRVHITKSGRQIHYSLIDTCWLEPPAQITTLNVLGFISAETNVVAGCENGLIATWSKFSSSRQKPCKILKRHTEAIVGLCTVNGHLLSLDQGGKLLMWSGYDLESKDSMPLVARDLADNFVNITKLVGYERWFATSSSEDGIINVWTLPDLWLRTG